MPTQTKKPIAIIAAGVAGLTLPDPTCERLAGETPAYLPGGKTMHS
jgi:hypothetical protein